MFSERTGWLALGKRIRKYLLGTYVLNAFKNDSEFSPLQHIPFSVLRLKISLDRLLISFVLPRESFLRSSPYFLRA